MAKPTKKHFTRKHKAALQRAALRRGRLNRRNRKLMAQNGLVAIDETNLLKKSSPAFKKLQNEWYGKVAAAEAKKPEAERWNDIEWQEDPNSPHLKRSGGKARRLLSPDEQHYFACCRNYLTHVKLRGREKLAWTMHTDGLSYRKIMLALKAKYKLDRSIYWVFYFVSKIRAKMKHWNSTAPEGLRDDGLDGFASDVLISDFGLAIAQPYELSDPKGD